MKPRPLKAVGLARKVLDADRQNRRPRGRPENVAFASASPGRVRGFRFRTFGLKFEFGLRQEP